MENFHIDHDFNHCIFHVLVISKVKRFKFWKHGFLTTTEDSRYWELDKLNFHFLDILYEDKWKSHNPNFALGVNREHSLCFSVWQMNILDTYWKYRYQSSSTRPLVLWCGVTSPIVTYYYNHVTQYAEVTHVWRSHRRHGQLCSEIHGPEELSAGAGGANDSPWAAETWETKST